MNTKQRFYIVDVFAEHAYAGNPLAVIVGDNALPDEKMQSIAAEMNFSETTFVTPVREADGGYRTRIYTPSSEIDFAGHPILGTAWVLRHCGSLGVFTEVRLNLAVGQVPVTFELSEDGRETVWFVAPPMSPGPTVPPEPVAAALGLSVADLDPALPVQVFTAGISAMIVPLTGLGALRRCKLDLDAFAPLSADGFPPLVYLFSRQTRRPENDLSVRFFFDAHGVREDPATGNGAAFLGAYLLEHGVFPDVSGLSLRVEQGHEVRRPSLILLRARTEVGERDVRVGGCVVATVKGELV